MSSAMLPTHLVIEACDKVIAKIEAKKEEMKAEIIDDHRYSGMFWWRKRLTDEEAWKQANIRSPGNLPWGVIQMELYSHITLGDVSALKRLCLAIPPGGSINVSPDDFTKIEAFYNK